MADRLCWRCEDTGISGLKPCKHCWNLCSTGCTEEKLCERHWNRKNY